MQGGAIIRSLSGTLTTAQKAAFHKPHPKVEVYDQIAGIARHTWTRFYTGEEEDYFHACCMPADGSLIRLRVTSADDKLYWQRVTSPASGSTYSSWTDWSKDAYAVAVCASGVNVWAFCIDVSDGHLYRSDSTDSGASFGSWTDMGDVSGDNTFRLAACAKSTTEAVILYADGTDIYRRRLASGTWEAAAKWSLSMATITGIAVYYSDDWNVVVTGTKVTTLEPIVNTCILGDGGDVTADTWASLKEHTIAESGSSMAFKFPCLGKPDVFRAFFVEDYDGSEAYSRPYWTHSLTTSAFEDNEWREPVPFNLSSDYGLAMCHLSPDVWLTRPDGVWQATLAAASVDITDDVLRLETDISETSGHITIVLRNDDGRYANIGVADDTYEQIKLGAEIQFSPGYHTTSGSSPEHSTGLAYWITGWDYTSSGGHAEFILHGIDGWGLLQRWKARRQFKWAAADKTIFELLTFIFARVGLEFAAIGSSSSAITDIKPAFTISTGESGRAVVLRLLAMVEEVLFFRGEYGYVKYPQTDDSTDYTYHMPGSDTNHRISEGFYGERIKNTNRVQVFGDEPTSIITEDFDWTEIALVYDNLAQNFDINLDSVARCHARGTALKAAATLQSITGYIIVPLNCGQEMYDFIEITDSRADLSADKKRVKGLRHVYNPAQGRYDLKIYPGISAAVADADEAEEPSGPVVRKGILKSFDAAAYTASVRIVGSLSVWLDNVRVAETLTAADMVAGRSVAVLFLDPGNPADAIVIGLWGAAAAGSGLGIFGDGSDSDVTISTNTTITRDMFYDDLTVNNGITLDTDLYRVFVKGTLTNNGTIEATPLNASGANGASEHTERALASGAAGGDGGKNHLAEAGGGGGGGGLVVMICAKHIVNTNGTIQANGGIGGQAADPGPAGTTAPENGAGEDPGMGGNGGAGGDSNGGSAGTGGTVTASAATKGGLRTLPFAIIFKEIEDTVAKIGGGGGGGGGGKDASGNAGGGGGGGGGCLMLIYNSLAAGTEQASGGAGGAAVGTGQTGTTGSAGTVIKIVNT